MGIEVRGAENFKKLATSLRAASVTLQRDMLTAIERSVQPLQQDIPASARRTLPKRGGLAAKVAASKISIRPGRGGVSVTTSNRYEIESMDGGKVRHPVYGNRARWVSQAVTPNWWTKPTTAAKPKIRRAAAQALDRIVAKIGR